MKPLEACRLYTFIDSAYLHGRDPVKIAHELCKGGSDLIQLRAKEWGSDQILEVAGKVAPVLKSYDVGFVINDHLAIAQEVGADFCHLGQEDFFDSGFHQIDQLPFQAGLTRPKIGLSTHAPEQAMRAVEAGAKYLGIGPIYSTATKPTAKAVTLQYVQWARKNISIPWFAIGGITLSNLNEVAAAGAKRICVVSAILNSKDIASTCAEFKTLLTKTQPIAG